MNCKYRKQVARFMHICNNPDNRNQKCTYDPERKWACGFREKERYELHEPKRQDKEAEATPETTRAAGRDSYPAEEENAAGRRTEEPVWQSTRVALPDVSIGLLGTVCPKTQLHVHDCREDAGGFALANRIEALPTDEREMIMLQLDRMDAGRKDYGAWVINKDKREYQQEMLEEIADALQYCSAQLIRLQREKDE